ncbi:hypothetical protein RclHR1_23900004 [Rhizophagus clarus]|nr:hypothetical protein RclHR1_23900004 [Rhizophagus clarus]
MIKTKNEVLPGLGLSTEQSIINDTYSTDKPTDKPSYKKAKITAHQDEDTHFDDNNSSETETVLITNNNKTPPIDHTSRNTEYNQQLMPEPTLTSISQDAKFLNASIHNPHMIVDHQERALIINQHNNCTTTPELQNQQTIPSMEITHTLQIEHISLEDQKQNPLNIFYSFIVKEEFERKSHSQISEIITEICGSLSRFLKIENFKEKYNHVEIVKISFINKTSRNSLNNVTNKCYNITFHNYDKTSLNKQTNHINKHKEERTIKVVEVPRSFSVKNIKDIFTTYGKIKNIFRVDKFTSNQKQNPTEAIWTVKIDRHLVKILPADPDNIEYKNCTLFKYKITGLHVDTNFYDLEPIINKIKGKTCTLPEINPKQIIRTAYINVHSEDYEKKIRIVNINTNRQIYITPVDTSTCIICEYFEHDFTNCINKDKIEAFFRNPKEARIIPNNNIKSSAPYLSKRENNLAHLTLRVNELKLTQQQHEQAITSINNQYKEVMNKIQEIQNTLESINRIDQTQNTILQMFKEIKNQQPIHKRNSRSSSLKKMSSNLRKNSADENLSNTPKSQSKTHYTRLPINRNMNK